MISGIAAGSVAPRNFSVRCIDAGSIQRTISESLRLIILGTSSRVFFRLAGSSIATKVRQDTCRARGALLSRGLLMLILETSIFAAATRGGIGEPWFIDDFATPSDSPDRSALSSGAVMAFFGPRMRRQVHLSRLRLRHMRVYLRRGGAGMAQQFLNDPQIGSTIK